MSLDDLPVVGRLAVAGGGLLDLAVNSGDLIAAALINVDALIPVLTVANRLAGRIPWLPTQQIDKVLTAALAALLVVYALRWINKLNSKANG
jgi:hypothetical protein